jgi:hypothetical protein
MPTSCLTENEVSVDLLGRKESEEEREERKEDTRTYSAELIPHVVRGRVSGVEDGGEADELLGSDAFPLRSALLKRVDEPGRLLCCVDEGDVLGHECRRCGRGGGGRRRGPSGGLVRMESEVVGGGAGATD